MMTLYEIGDEMQALEDFLEQIDGDISNPDFEQMIDEWLETNKNLLADKLDSYGKLIKNKQLLSEAQLVEAKRLTEAATVNSNFIKKMKERLRDFFQYKKLKKVEGTLFKFWIQNNSSRSMTINETYDGEEGVKKLPEVYQKVVITPDTTKIGADLREMEMLINKRDACDEERVPEKFTADDLARLDELSILLDGVAWFEPVGQHIRIK